MIDETLEWMEENPEAEKEEDDRELVHVHNKELSERVIEMEHELDSSRKVIDHL